MRTQAARWSLCLVQTVSACPVSIDPASLASALHILTTVSSFQHLKCPEPLSMLHTDRCLSSVVRLGAFAFLRPQLTIQFSKWCLMDLQMTLTPCFQSFYHLFVVCKLCFGAFWILKRWKTPTWVSWASDMQLLSVSIPFVVNAELCRKDTHLTLRQAEWRQDEDFRLLLRWMVKRLMKTWNIASFLNNCI